MAYAGSSALNNRFPVYQLDFTAQATGKRVASTKRRVRWRFGFTNTAALEAGETGMACRGEEHDVTLVWSIASGKRQITMDGREVNFATSRASIIDFSWPMKGNHMLKVTAHAAPPMQATPGFRQYDLRIDGQSFFSLPKVFELGVGAGAHSGGRYPGDYRTAPPRSLQSQEEADIQRAIQESLKESQSHLARTQGNGYSNGEPAPAPTQSNLLDFASPAVASPAVLPPAPVPQAPPSVVTVPPPMPMPQAPQAAYGAPPPVSVPAPYAPAAPGAVVPYQPGAPAPGPMPFASPGTVPPAPTNPLVSPGVASTASAPPPTQYAPVPVPAAPAYATSAPAPTFGGAPDPFAKYDDPFAPKPPPPPTQSDIHSAILGAYGSAEPTTPQASSGMPQPNFSTPQNGTVAPGANGVEGLSMNAPLTITEEAAGPPKSELEKAMNNLVNFDDISAPAQGELKLTMEKEESKKDKYNPYKSKPLPPVASNQVGSGATLQQIQVVKPTMPPKDPEAIMKPPVHLYHPDAVNAGALVVHGEGPPPLRPQGFGVGYGNYTPTATQPNAYGGYGKR